MYSSAIVNALLTFVFKYSRRKSCSGIINPSKPSDCFVYHLILHSRFSNSAYRWHFCVLHASQSKQRLFTYRQLPCSFV